ncbi:hypothetical protein [Roseiarcus sp.]|uniref:hypothetical protein n=1 Tax=Roseiarcus sp. TaxID=1969460 RepID=UPI003F958E92
MLVHAFKGPYQFKPASLPLAPTEELWLGVVGALVIVWLALTILAPGRGSNIASTCNVHGRAALVCRPETAAPFSAPQDLNCTSFGRGGRVCSDRQ